MLLVVDIGNTNAVFGVYEGDKLKSSFRVASDKTKTSDELGILFGQLLEYKNIERSAIKACIISSVVPPMTPNVEEMINDYFGLKPIIVGPGVKTGLNIKYENPKEVGADRIVNAVAALNLYGGPLIVVDFGTATTFCAISEKWEYLGGVVCPGVGISAEALFERASKLPRVEIIRTEKIIGKNTVSSMQAGLYYGYVGQVDGIVRRMQKELDWQAKVVATGGLAKLLGEGSETVNVINPTLTLDGLRLIYELNQ